MEKVHFGGDSGGNHRTAPPRHRPDRDLDSVSGKRYGLGSIIDARRSLVSDTVWFGLALLVISISMIIETPSWTTAAIALLPFSASLVLLFQSRKPPR
jgi:hypothetical protein